jgi:Protein of unknown function (DUF3489)
MLCSGVHDSENGGTTASPARFALLARNGDSSNPTPGKTDQNRYPPLSVAFPLSLLQKATDWQAHSVRGFLSGAVKKKMGLRVTTAKLPDGTRTYRVLSK